MSTFTILKSIPPFSAVLSFLKIIYYHPSPSQLISRILPLIFLWTPRGLSLQNLSWIFSYTCIFHHGCRKKFQIYSVKLLQIHLWVKNLNLFIFTHAPKNSPLDYHYPPGWWELPIPLEQHFLMILLPEKKGRWEDYGVEKMTTINKGICHKFW